MLHTGSSFLTKGSALRLILVGAALLSLGGCDLAKNHMKADRTLDMEVQDYRDALGPRLPDPTETANQAGIPDLQSYIATPNDTSKPMPLVSISINQSVPLRDALYELANQADYDIELDPRITGSVIFTARNKPFDQVIDKLASNAGLRYEFRDDSVRIELDTPYHHIYKINYLSYVRTNQSGISNDIAVVSGEGADTGSKFKAESKSVADFWGEMDRNLLQLLSVTPVNTLRTAADPRMTAAADTAAPVEPVILTADGEIARPATPTTVLRVESLPTEADGVSTSGASDPFIPRYSLNQQAGVISVYATERLHKRVAEYLEAVRKSVTSQVLIEAKVLEVSLSDEFAAGIDWEALNLFGRNFTFGAPSFGASVAPGLSPTPSPGITLNGVYNSGDLNVAVQAISRFGTVHALASPRLTVLNNQTAVLNVAKNQVYFEIDVNTSESDFGRTVDVNSNIRNVPEGVLINVQPSIDLDTKTISMAVRPTVTRITEYVNDPSVAFAVANAGVNVDIQSAVPIVNVQEFDSVLKVNNGQAIVMGGLIQDRTNSQQVGVPVLSEVPVLGGLFRNQRDSIQKTELVVLLKATIVERGNSIHPTDRDMYRTFSQDRRPYSEM